MAELKVTVKACMDVDTDDARLCAKMLEIWLNANEDRNVVITRTFDDGKTKIELVPESPDREQ